MVRIILASALLALPVAARPALNMWTDKDGVLHLEDAPPPGPRRGRAQRKVEPVVPKKLTSRRSDAPPDQIDKAAALYKIPAELVRAVILAESAGDASAVSHRGAIGLMQLMPQTAGQMYVDDPVDPAQNIQGGTRYLRLL